MASENHGEGGKQASVLALFRGGKSKAEIARALGCTKKVVARLLAVAIRGMGK